MERVQNSALPDEPPMPIPSTNQKEPKPNVVPWNGDREAPGHKYSREANEPSHRRPRRATRSKENNTCSLFIQTDPLIWRHISEQVREIYFKSIAHDVEKIFFLISLDLKSIQFFEYKFSILYIIFKIYIIIILYSLQLNLKNFEIYRKLAYLIKFEMY